MSYLTPSLQRALVIPAALLSFSVGAQSLPSKAAIDAKIAEEQARTARTLEALGNFKAPPAPQGGANLPSTAAVRQQMATPNNVDAQVARWIKGGTTAEKKSDLIVFVSFSMPDRVIRELSRQAKDAGAIIALRGFHKDSARKTQARAAEVNDGGVEWEVNSNLFTQFKVNKVPTIVLASTKAKEVDSEGCAPEREFVSVAGDMSIEAALRTMTRRAPPPFVALAEERLSGIRKAEGR